VNGVVGTITSEANIMVCWTCS
jgi:hypothetical protein